MIMKCFCFAKYVFMSFLLWIFSIFSSDGSRRVYSYAEAFISQALSFWQAFFMIFGDVNSHPFSGVARFNFVGNGTQMTSTHRNYLFIYCVLRCVCVCVCDRRCFKSNIIMSRNYGGMCAVYLCVKLESMEILCIKSSLMFHHRNKNERHPQNDDNRKNFVLLLIFIYRRFGWEKYTNNCIIAAVPLFHLASNFVENSKCPFEAFDDDHNHHHR